jgi:hypothetical protein
MPTLVRIAPLLVAALVLVAGCSSRINQENYEKIQNGMSVEEVNDILGKPTRLESFGIGGLSASTASWVGKTDTITVTFGNGTVKLKSYGPSTSGNDR